MKRLPVVVVHYLWLWPTSYSFGILKSRRRAAEAKQRLDEPKLDPVL